MRQHTQSPVNLARLAVNEEVDSLMLLAQLGEELILEFLQGVYFVIPARYCRCLRLAFGRVLFDQMLDVVVVDII